MQDLKELKEAVELYKEENWGKANPDVTDEQMKNGLRTLLDLAQLFLECEGFPEKKEYHNQETVHFPTPFDWTLHKKEVDIFNEALDLCLLAHVKLMQESRLTVAEKINSIIKYLKIKED